MGREFFYRECLYETRREEVDLGDDAGVGGLAGSEDLMMPNVSEYRHVAFPFHDESRGRIPAAAGPVFAHLDDQIRLAAHMSQRSWRMAWGRMVVELDQQGGRAVGSHIRLEGRVLGIRLELDEVVTEYTPPSHKMWETVGAPRLLVIGPYRMGFTLVPDDLGPTGSTSEQVVLTVFIDYALPDRGVSRLLGRLFGSWYARWCTSRMVDDARAAFANSTLAAGIHRAEQPAR